MHARVRMACRCAVPLLTSCRQEERGTGSRRQRQRSWLGAGASQETPPAPSCPLIPPPKNPSSTQLPCTPSKAGRGTRLHKEAVLSHPGRAKSGGALPNGDHQDIVRHLKLGAPAIEVGVLAGAVGHLQVGKRAASPQLRCPEHPLPANPHFSAPALPCCRHPPVRRWPQNS